MLYVVLCCLFGQSTHATLHFDDDGKKQYKLVNWPLSHECMPSPLEHLIEMFSPLCYEEVSSNPTKPIGQIYKDVREKLSAELSEV